MEQNDKAMKLAKDFLLTGTFNRKMKWKAWRDKEEARKARIKELERERERERDMRISLQYIKNSKKKSRKEDGGKQKSLGPEKNKRKYPVF